ncbi:MAG: SAM-dependent chlorinase/fluorinase [Elusimicrobia bacterium]|nr:SAM-dependent chlorinase/fluorinase [Elusimicrobiota bacterium]
MTGPIVLLTDFGFHDPFVGIMKGVVLSIAPKAQIVDLCHAVPPQDVRTAAFHLRVSTPYFPKGALFVAVVDPGVGTARKVLWARTAKHQFLGPDNGVLSWIGEPVLEMREVNNHKLFLHHLSATFHGRDIFAPVAGHLAKGKAPKELGPKTKPAWEIEFPQVMRNDGAARGEIIGFDRFGNAVTNMTRESVPEGCHVFFGDSDLGLVSHTYAGRDPGEVMAIIGSSGFLELAVREGNFQQHFKAKAGDAVESRT